MPWSIEESIFNTVPVDWRADFVRLDRSKEEPIPLHPEHIKHAIKFGIDMDAEKSNGGVHLYADESSDGANKRAKFMTDCIYGKMGEWGVYSLLLSRGIPCSEPEPCVPGKRDFKPDLMFGPGLRGAVKTQEYRSSFRFGTAWLVNRDGAARTDSEFWRPLPNDTIFLTTVMHDGIDIASSSAFYVIPRHIDLVANVNRQTTSDGIVGRLVGVKVAMRLERLINATRV